MAEQVTLFEMSPRDGLQNEPGSIAAADKIALVDYLTLSGLKKIEVASFVDPRRVPQMADGAKVLAGIKRGGARYTALTPNVKGYQRAKEAGADEVAVFAAASESFSMANINSSIADSLERFKPLMEMARADKMPVRGYISCVTDCPYEGKIAPRQVAYLAEKLLKIGCYEISLGDTIGHGTAQTVSLMLDAVLQYVPPERLAGHFHDTRGNALGNIHICLEKGLRVFDASAGGLGGCPFAPNAPGNVSTESVVEMLSKAGLSTGIDPAALAKAASFARSLRRPQ